MRSESSKKVEGTLEFFLKKKGPISIDSSKKRGKPRDCSRGNVLKEVLEGSSPVE